ncbi:hypothetical protein AKJ61_03485 [candidate division MSBL1 archaeon SCGC-AAA259B11]|uniref:HVO-A0261-like N-terminal domain-containing protein n=1 Tax=candidate division MSBL1 archaeon SCGC-AAA259B11 TaxID=1698260 RepID=A0A133U4M5_9EURY|nr:hypothetical protein AKJ61_03485 [candidate division MSBL1 archaeon SCGC-AAA259B11]
MDYELLSFVKRSERRKQIVTELQRPSTPKEIAQRVGVSLPHVSRTLREFRERGIAECKTPEAKIGRIYKLTEQGREILQEVD